jgi:hypothetical protein
VRWFTLWFQLWRTNAAGPIPISVEENPPGHENARVCVLEATTALDDVNWNCQSPLQLQWTITRRCMNRELHVAFLHQASMHDHVILSISFVSWRSSGRRRWRFVCWTPKWCSIVVPSFTSTPVIHPVHSVSTSCVSGCYAVDCSVPAASDGKNSGRRQSIQIWQLQFRRSADTKQWPYFALKFVFRLDRCPN